MADNLSAGASGPGPVTFGQAAAHLRLGDDTSEQLLVEGYISVARELVEDCTGHILVPRQTTDHFSRVLPRLKLTKRPVLQVMEVSYADAADELQLVSDYVVGSDRQGTFVSPGASRAWPRMSAHGSVSVTYLAGYGPGAAPHRMIQAILLATADFYKNREPSLSAEAERAIDWLLRGLRRRVL